MNTPRLAAAALLAATAPALAAAADDPAKWAIETRQGYFKLLATELGPLGSMAKGEIDYDAAKAEAHAADLAALAGYDFTAAALFMKGTSKFERPGETRALAVIWDDPEGFAERAEAFVAAVEALPAVAGQGRGEMAAAVSDIGNACGDCHDDFRADEF